MSTKIFDELEYNLWIEGICPIGHSDLGLLFAVNIVTFTLALTVSELLRIDNKPKISPIYPLGGVAPHI